MTAQLFTATRKGTVTVSHGAHNEGALAVGAVEAA
jgi:hypothetical protein